MLYKIRIITLFGTSNNINFGNLWFYLIKYWVFNNKDIAKTQYLESILKQSSRNILENVFLVVL